MPPCGWRSACRQIAGSLRLPGPVPRGIQSFKSPPQSTGKDGVPAQTLNAFREPVPDVQRGLPFQKNPAIFKNLPIKTIIYKDSSNTLEIPEVSPTWCELTYNHTAKTP